jgi:hypothetical protein
MCILIEESEHLQAGWGCCHCRTYNGLWRDKCKQCNALHCKLKNAKETLEARDDNA